MFGQPDTSENGHVPAHVPTASTTVSLEPFELTNEEAEELYMSGAVTEKAVKDSRTSPIPWCRRLDLRAIGVLLRAGIPASILNNCWAATFTTKGKVKQNCRFEGDYRMWDSLSKTWFHVYSKRDGAWLAARKDAEGLTKPDSHDSFEFSRDNSLTLDYYGGPRFLENVPGFNGIQGPLYKFKDNAFHRRFLYNASGENLFSSRKASCDVGPKTTESENMNSNSATKAGPKNNDSNSGKKRKRTCTLQDGDFDSDVESYLPESERPVKITLRKL